MKQLFTALVEFVEQHEVLLSALASGAVLLGILSRIRRRLWRLIRAGGTKILAIFRRSDRPVARNLKELLKQIKPLLDDNGRIFRDFGPNSGSAGTGPIRGREKLALWQDLKISAVVPNNVKIRRIVRVERHDLPGINVYLSDAYCYTEAEFLSRPANIQRGDFILVAKPEGSVTTEALQHARAERIGVGKIGRLMGALNYPEVWSYEPPESRSAKDRRAS